MLYTVFCDESCHLQKDNSSVMVLGAMYCLCEKRKQIYSDIRCNGLFKSVMAIIKNFR